jgi:hypothetical protein
MAWFGFGLLLLASIVTSTDDDSQGDSQSQGWGGAYSNCRYSIIGAGWGGVYYAYRISLSDDAIVNPRFVCIFEVSSRRVGGRAYSFIPGWEDVRVDLGAYRWWIGSELIKGTNRVVLGKPAICYHRAGYCNDTETIRDPYGNNAGYSTGVEGLVQKLRGAGMRPVYFSHALTNVRRNQDNGYKLTFANNATVFTDEVYLNVGPTPLRRLANNNIIQTGASAATKSALFETVLEVGSGKQHLRYDDAWWFTKLGLADGEPWIQDNVEPPLEGINFFDGPIKCKAPGSATYLTSRPALPFSGSCWGVLNTYYAGKWPETNDPNQTFVNPDLIWYRDNYGHDIADDSEVSVQISRGDPGDALLDMTHNRVINFLQSYGYFDGTGIDPASIAPPTSTVFSIWDSANYRWNFPGIHTTVDDFDFSLRNKILKLVPGERVYIGNAAWGGSLSGWAESSLTLAERNLVYHHGFKKPDYVSSGYWKYVVTPSLPNPARCNSNSDCPDTLNQCITNKCNNNNQCVLKYKTNDTCDDYNPCTTNDQCSATGTCAGTPVTCSSGQICVSGSCQSPSSPPLPNCSASIGPSWGPIGMVYWNWVGTDKIRIAFSLPGTAWVGLGVGASMTPADIVFGWVNGDGTFNVGDRWSFSNYPHLDEAVGGTNDISNVYAEQVNGITTIWFTRKLNTGDSRDQIIYKNAVTNFIYGFQSGAPGTYIKHDWNTRGVQVIDLNCPN